MRRAAALMALLLLLLGAARAEDRPVTGYTVREHSAQTLADGVVYERLTLAPAADNPTGRPQRVFLLDVDPTASSSPRLLGLASEDRLHKRLRNLPAILTRARGLTAHRVIGGVNGDFFDIAAGGSMGYLKENGVWLTAGEFPEGWAVGLTPEGRPVIGQPKVTLTLTLPDGTALPIDALNGLRGDVPKGESTPAQAHTARKDNRLVLYTPAFGTRTRAQGGGAEVTLAAEAALTAPGTLEAAVTRVVRKNARGGGPIAEDTFVLSAIGGPAELLRSLSAGDRVRLTLAVAPPFDTSPWVVGGGRADGGPLLLLDGQAADLAPFRATAEDAAYFYRRQPRTAVGLRGDGSYFLLVVEGRRSGSAGMFLEELQTLLKDLGAETALNLDGGPSATMTILHGGKWRTVTDSSGTGKLIQVGSAIAICVTPEEP